MKKKINYNRALSLILRNKLPKDFDQWELTDGETSIAHTAAMYGFLPKDFDRWGLTDICGRTVAHLAVMYETLPDDFDRWDIISHDGRTVQDIYNEFNKV